MFFRPVAHTQRVFFCAKKHSNASLDKLLITYNLNTIMSVEEPKDTAHMALSIVQRDEENLCSI